MASLAWRCLVLVAAVSTAVADERFYTVMGPDGRLQVIREAAPAAPSSPVASGARTDAATSSEASAAPARNVGPDNMQEPVPTTPGGLAPYDSDEFTDVEVVDGELHKQQSRKRFYLVNDGMGAQVRESSAAPEASGEPAAVGSEAKPVPKTVRFRAIQPAYAELTGESALTAYSGLRECQAQEALGGFRDMKPDEAQSVVLSRQVYQFPDRTGMVVGYRVAGEGLRALVLRSYSRTERNPAYAEPALAFLDGQGCLRRIVTGYADRLYEASDKSHSSLRAEVEMRGDERYLLVMATPTAAPAAPERAFSSSRYGQIKLFLKK